MNRHLFCAIFCAVAALCSIPAARAKEVTLPDGYVPVNLVTNVGGSASSDTKCLNSDSSYGVAKAFDKKYYKDNTRWIGHGSRFPQRAVWTFPEATIVDTVRIYNAEYRGAKQSPSEFSIAGSNDDGATWTTLDSESGVTGWDNSQFRTFGFENAIPYKKYRLEVTAVQDMTGSEGKRMTITEIELYRVNQASFEVVPSGSLTIGIDTFSTDWNLTVEESATAAAGIVWSTDETFATAVTNSLGTSLSAGKYTASLSELEPDTTYWWKIYAVRGNETKETIAYSFKTFGAPVTGDATVALNGESATFTVSLAKAALGNTLSTSVSAFYGTDGENWTELSLGSAATAATLTGSVDHLGYGVTYQWFVRATATMEGGRVLSTDSATNNFTTLWNGDIYVDAASASAAKPYSTPESAAKTIAAALALAMDGATIHVAPGRYNISTPIEVTKAIAIIGTDADPSRTVISNTVKANHQSGQGTKRIFTLNNSNAFVANLTMQNGSVWGDWAVGGNFLISSGGGTVSNCIVEAGFQISGHGGGGGGHLEAGVVTHTVFRGNYVSASTSEGKNKAGVLRLKGASRAENCLLVENPQSSAAVLVQIEGTSLLRNCTIVDSRLNSTNQYCTVFSPLHIGSATASAVNVVVAGVTDKDGVLRKPTGTRANFLYGALDSSIEGTSFPVDTVVGTAESFFKDYANGDYTPKTGGPLVGKGANYDDMASVDLAGKPRLVRRKVDIGCYESQSTPMIILVR